VQLGKKAHKLLYLHHQNVYTHMRMLANTLMIFMVVQNNSIRVEERKKETVDFFLKKKEEKKTRIECKAGFLLLPCCLLAFVALRTPSVE
jgi:dsDNA-binding SOS-regulon protein